MSSGRALALPESACTRAGARHLAGSGLTARQALAVATGNVAQLSPRQARVIPAGELLGPAALLRVDR